MKSNQYLNKIMKWIKIFYIKDQNYLFHCFYKLFLLTFWAKTYSTIEGSLLCKGDYNKYFLKPYNILGSILSKLLGVFNAGNLPVSKGWTQFQNYGFLKLL
jgi:hypothetical protein